jgi:hypothetical protein
MQLSRRFASLGPEVQRPHHFLAPERCGRESYQALQRRGVEANPCVERARLSEVVALEKVDAHLAEQ